MPNRYEQTFRQELNARAAKLGKKVVERAGYELVEIITSERIYKSLAEIEVELEFLESKK